MTSALVQLAYDPNNIKPGWVAFVLVLSLGVATYFLWRSMNTQLRKIQVPPAGAAKLEPTPPPPDDVEGSADPTDEGDENPSPPGSA